MSREVKRVALDFDWPLNKVWEGYLHPERFAEINCPDCKNGYAPYAKHLFDQWYGKIPFDPQSTGSTPLTVETPAVRAFAERNVERGSWYYGTGEAAIVREAKRLIGLWNGQWCHHLAQEDVDVLIAKGRLWDFTHRWNPETRKSEKIDPPVTPTAAEVNEWNIRTMGHDSLNAGYVIKARCERDGQPHMCATCEGHGSLEKYAGQRAEAKAWEATEPPTGDGWQLWETVTDGSPVTPVFATADELIDHLATVGQYHGPDHVQEPMRRAAAETLVRNGSTLGSMVQRGDVMYQSDLDADLIDQAGAD